MHLKTISLMGSLGLFLVTGAARGGEQAAKAGTSAASEPAGGRECKDAGVTVAFKTGSAELDQNARGALDGVATWLKGDPTRTLHLEGFADTTGDSEANLVLSAARAEAAKNYLVSVGVDPTKVATVGRGEEIDHLPANGRAVTFLACRPPGAGPAMAGAIPEAEVPGEVAPLPSAEPAPMPAPPPPTPRYERGFGWALMAGGNYQDFTNSDMRSVTSGGGGWDARFIGGTNSIIGFEAAYVGAAHSINGLGVTANTPALVANGLEGNFRLNAPIRRGNSLFEPYGYIGLGFAHYSVSNYNQNTQTLSSFTSSDDVMTFPVGGGIAYAYKAFIIDARAGWTGSYNQDLFVNGASSNTLNNWNVGGQLGYVF